MLTEAAERGQEVVQPPAIREEKKVGILSYFRPASRVKPLAKRSRFRQRKWFRGSQVAALRKKGNGRTAPKKRRGGVGSEAAARLAGFPSLSFLYLFLSFFSFPFLPWLLRSSGVFLFAFSLSLGKFLRQPLGKGVRGCPGESLASSKRRLSSPFTRFIGNCPCTSFADQTQAPKEC